MTLIEMEKPRTRPRAFAAAPSAGALLGGSALWALAMMLSAIVSLRLDGWRAPANILPIALLFAAGGFCAFAPALLAARFIAAERPRGVRFAAAFLSLAGATILLTIVFYCAEHRLTFDEGHAVPFTVDWLLELAFTFAAASYRFALFGLSLYFPLGLLFLIAASFWNARAAR